MKLVLPVPIRKVQVNAGTYTFHTENRVVDVIAVSRTSAGPGRWHYTAHYRHPEAHPEASRVGIDDSLTCWIRRADHRHWKPPAFDRTSTVIVSNTKPKGGQQ